MKIEFEKINPDRAKAMLGNSHANRNLRRGWVSLLARDMKAGRWQKTGQAIIISLDGKLLDGQHRLHAIIESGQTIEIAVATGIADDAFHSIDTGRPRNAADVLGISGVKNSRAVAAATQRVAFLLSGAISGLARDTNTGKLSPSALVSFYETLDRDYMAEMILVAGRAVERFRYVTVSDLASLGYVAGSVFHSNFMEFCELTGSGAGLDDGSPVLALRNWLVNATGLSRATTRDGKAFAHARAWTAFARGESLFRIVYNPTKDGGANPPQGLHLADSRDWIDRNIRK